ncbi:ribosomal protein l7ae, putative [Entamoeba invadens IP1]|uniref:H/ACA ribonucleoprotein complex subunit 2 n=1 Tax=Entamoeba invadens IP1 TaxID=370355 RepID=A0A0A1UH37_ENTIV|nr:ribosomal protein l7ae, putative [Entamoeba invadens IP1]ELP94608.1 ribosomal protein l7ae, putative [Entamoeba invadens IP1]|eukprot:XP_004261379.1 ribosomal protein l7ae, putative [Entamoeba invadens IP1]
MSAGEQNSKIFPKAPKELQSKLIDFVQQGYQKGLVKKGANEVTKALNRGRAEVAILAADAEPIEILLHIPILCEDKNVPYVFVSSKAALGRACGVSRDVIAVALLGDKGTFSNSIETVRDEIEKLLF